MSVEGESTPLLDAAQMAHELFKTYVQAGFTEDQALRMISYLMGQMALGQGGEAE